MKVPYTRIVGTECDEGSVVIRFRPQGSDEADAPLVLRVSPHANYIFVAFNHVNNRHVFECETGFNQVKINFENLPRS